MKRRNQFLKYGRMFNLDDGAGGVSENDNQDNIDNDEIDNIIDEEKEKFDVKEILKQQQEQIKQQQEKYELLLAKLEKTKERTKEKTSYLTAEEVEAIYDKKDKERRVTEKLSNYGITGERLDKLKGLPPESLQVVLDELKERTTLPNTRKVGGGKTGQSKTIMTIEDILSEL